MGQGWHTSSILSMATYLGAALVLCLAVHGKELLNHFNLQIVIQRWVMVFRAAGLGVRKEDMVQAKDMVPILPEVQCGRTPQIQFPSTGQVSAEGPLPKSCVI